MVNATICSNSKLNRQKTHKEDWVEIAGIVRIGKQSGQRVRSVGSGGELFRKRDLCFLLTWLFGQSKGYRLAVRGDFLTADWSRQSWA